MKTLLAIVLTISSVSAFTATKCQEQIDDAQGFKSDIVQLGASDRLSANDSLTLLRSFRGGAAGYLLRQG